MLNLLIGWKEYKLKMREHEISVELLPLNNESMLVLSPIMARDINKEDKVALYSETFEMQKLASSVLKNHAKNLKGIMINGKIPSWQQIAEEAILAELAVMLLGKLFVISTLTEAEVKN